MQRLFLCFLFFFSSIIVNSQSVYKDTISLREYDLATNFVSHQIHIRKKIQIEKTINWEIQMRNGRIADTLKFNLSRVNNIGLISYVECKGGVRNEKITFDSSFNCFVNLVDTLDFFWNNQKNTLMKFKGDLSNGIILTFFYSDSLGIIKFYSNYKSLCFENYSDEKDLLNASLKEIYLNPEFHTRYDKRSRTIGFLPIDYKLAFGSRKKKIKKKVDQQFRMFGLPCPCEAGYLDSCY